MKKLSANNLANGLVALVLVLVPFHAFLTVWASQLVGHFTLLRLWDETVLALLMAISCYWLVRYPELRRRLLASRLFKLIAAYVLLTLLLGAIAYSRHLVTAKALGYAFIINLRLAFWLVTVWLTAARSKWLQDHWQKLIFWPLAVVVIFGLLQFFVLPHDFLMHFGYNDSHSLSYVDGLTLNQDSNVLRVQSTLRGSNQLGGYLVVCVVLILTSLRTKKDDWPKWLLGALTIATLLLTFSRSAWLGALVAVPIMAYLKFKRFRRRFVWAGIVLACAAAVTFAALHNNSGFQDVILHQSNHSTAVQTSNQGHESALRSSLHDLRHQPFGQGPGTAGQASAYNTGHADRNTESYWLQIGLESGWLGLLVFAGLLFMLGKELWTRRSNQLALGLLAALIGLVVVNFFAYGFADDTLAYIFWGLAGVALAPRARRIT